jgi:hypothetical protein
MSFSNNLSFSENQEEQAAKSKSLLYPAQKPPSGNSVVPRPGSGHINKNI